MNDAGCPYVQANVDPSTIAVYDETPKRSSSFSTMLNFLYDKLWVSGACAIDFSRTLSSDRLGSDMLYFVNLDNAVILPACFCGTDRPPFSSDKR